MSDPNTVRPQMKEIFLEHDIDKDGYLAFEDAVQVLKEVGEEIKPQTLKQFFDLIDSDHDGKVSFEELFTWFSYSDSTDLPTEQEAKLRILNFLKKTKQTVNKMSEHFTDEDFGIDTHTLEVSTGNTQNAKTEFELKFYMGLEAEQKFEGLSKNLDLSDNLSLVIQFKSIEPEAAKQNILDALEAGRELLEAFVPRDIDIKGLKIVGSTDGENVNIGFNFENPLFETLVEEFKSIFLTMIPNEFSASLGLEMKFMKSVLDLIKEEVQGTNPQGRNIVFHILEGANLKLDFKLTGQLLKSLRNQYLNSKSYDKLPEVVKKAIFMLLIKGSNFKLNLDEGEISFLEPYIGDSSKSFQSVVKLLKQAPIGRMLLMIPPLSLFADTAVDMLYGDISVGIKGPRLLAHLHFKTEGLKQLWDLIPKE